MTKKEKEKEKEKEKMRKACRESQRRRRQKAREEGLCIACCKEKAEEGRTLCETCRKLGNKRMRERRRKIMKLIIPEGFTDRLLEEMDKKKVKAADLAIITGSSKAVVEKWLDEVNVMNIARFAAIVKHLGVSADYLLFGKEK